MLDLRELDLNMLLAFDAIYAQLSITRAAAVMGLSQPAMSNALRRLRSLCGDPLFVKSHLGVTPTLVAHRLSEHVRGALDGLREGLSQMPAMHHQEPQRPLRISCMDCFQPLLLDTLLAPGEQEWQVRFYQSRRRDALQELGNGKLDLLIDIDQPVSLQSGLRKLPLLSDHYVFAYGSGLDQPPRTLADYLRLPQVQVSSRREGLGPVDLELGLKGMRRNIAASVQSPLAARLIADRQALGLTLPSRVATVLGLRQAPLPLERPVLLKLCLYVENRYRFERGMDRALAQIQKAFAERPQPLMQREA
ncbi:putative HTH-type transcriptional regulator YbdO [compost metagenome]